MFACIDILSRFDSQKLVTEGDFEGQETFVVVESNSTMGLPYKSLCADHFT